jgi:hypothetical protein
MAATRETAYRRRAAACRAGLTHPPSAGLMVVPGGTIQFTAIASMAALRVLACNAAKALWSQVKQVLRGVAWLTGDGTSGKSGQPAKIVPIPEVPLRTQSAIVTITHAVTVAAGVYAPGHLGELTLSTCHSSWSMTSWSRPGLWPECC